MQRVLVTGGTGVIGAWVTRAFVERDITPIVFVRGQTDAIGQSINGDIEHRLVRAYGDIADADSVGRAIRDYGAQAVVHMASAKPWQMEAPFVHPPNLKMGLEQIAVGTLNVLEAARRTGVKRVVYASSKAVYDDVAGVYGPPAYAPLPEDYPKTGPRLVYGVGKLAAEHLGAYYERQYGLEFLTVRFASSYGPLKRGPSDTSPDGMFQAAVAGRTVQIRRFGGGQRDDYVYNKDIGQAFVLATLATKPHYRAFNIGAGTTIDHTDIARAIMAVLPSAQVEFTDTGTPAQGSDITDRARCLLDISRARADLGYVPRFDTLEKGYADFLLEEDRVRTGRAS